MKLRTFHPPHPFGKINVTPMIDVVMCLIVFYLIVGKLAADQRSAMRLPASVTGAEDKAQDLLIVNVMPGPAGQPPRIVIDTTEIPPDRMAAAIKEKIGAKPDVVVELRGSRELSYGSVAGVIRACKEAGVGSVRLATERIGGGAPGAPR